MSVSVRGTWSIRIAWSALLAFCIPVVTFTGLVRGTRSADLDI